MKPEDFMNSPLLKARMKEAQDEKPHYNTNISSNSLKGITMIYRISYIVENDTSPGVITSQDRLPQLGEMVDFGLGPFIIVDVCEILPPKDGTQFLVVTLREITPKPRTLGLSS